eukprot:scaffold36639_cov32-Tisochrysis_lutea.AAC.6
MMNKHNGRGTPAGKTLVTNHHSTSRSSACRFTPQYLGVEARGNRRLFHRTEQSESAPAPGYCVAALRCPGNRLLPCA